jgi:hypothetical protein
MVLAFTGAALVLCYLVARERFGAATSGWAALRTFLGSPIGWNVARWGEPPLAARLLFGSVAAYAWVRGARGAPDRTRWGWGAAGLAAGLAATLQWPGSPARLLEGGAVEVLWSSRGGLFATSPALYVGALGLLALWRVDRILAGVGAALLLLTTLLVASVDFWWTAGRPSAPAFAALTPYLVCGAAAAVDAVARWVTRRPVLATGVVLSPLVVWNVMLMQVAQDGGLRLGEPASFGDLGAAQARALHDWIGHPPSAPANLAYAALNGVRPGKYDLLSPNRLLARGAVNGAIDIGAADDDLFVGAGWYGRELDPQGSFRWATGSALVDVPLDRAADLEVGVGVRPYHPPGRPGQQLTLVVNGSPFGPVSLADGWQTATVTIPHTAWRAGINRLELRFAYDAKPADSGAADGRTLAASVDTVTVRAAS